MFIAALMTALIWASSRVDWRSHDTRAPHLFDRTNFTTLCASVIVFCLQTYTAILSICVRGAMVGNKTLWTSIGWNSLVMMSYALILERAVTPGFNISMRPSYSSLTTLGPFSPVGNICANDGTQKWGPCEACARLYGR
ncbi:hypothetical protein BDK51DRAFT_49808 [Blyttiomyces helicus]|uniref:Uncharacterized protein n=1 Tax=Blyttiomyces helicus TaxID=388810 RepID=A0A4P9WF21_9FUNG|nr:hypothetical protein BDK51DRAFT_49808 [Blyttiomyces helicus]|eukprot:RKO91002.1 hypothetical protein BDK51DRAFT_49808 [Blyttiomyces helicus]